MQRGWSQAKLAHRLVEVAVRYQGAARPESLVKMISKWEGDHLIPDQYNRHLLAEALDVTVGDLGISLDPDFVMLPAQR
ncbi:hypothetical protein ACQP2F_14835 [Actinoplanes sp. CA-030573]|uniref:hypothetical protein n=1 Tax=Actinoplanes sp. CA-030573 TaxID=3239898 RepID=UPI003D8A1BBE